MLLHIPSQLNDEFLLCMLVASGQNFEVAGAGTGTRHHSAP